MKYHVKKARIQINRGNHIFLRYVTIIALDLPRLIHYSTQRTRKTQISSLSLRRYFKISNMSQGTVMDGGVL